MDCRYTLFIICPHIFNIAFLVKPYKTVGSTHDLLSAAVVRFHEQHLTVRVSLLEAQQPVRISPAKTIDTLVLVAHHKDIAVLSRKKPDNFILNLRGVLGFIDIDVLVLAGKNLQQLRVFL